jgi:hypothetical protein
MQDNRKALSALFVMHGNVLSMKCMMIDKGLIKLFTPGN